MNPIATAFSSGTFADVMAPDAKLEDNATVTFETSDKFIYVVKVGKAVGENYPITVAITAALAKERAPGKDEKPEDKTKLDDVWAFDVEENFWEEIRDN